MTKLTTRLIAHSVMAFCVLLCSASTFVHAGAFDDFIKAMELDDADTAEKLLRRGFDPNSIDPRRYPMLTLALKNQSFKVAGVLIDDKGTNFDVPNPHGETPLMYAALHGQTGMIKKMLARGAQPNKEGWTALHYAASSGHTDICQMLLDADAYIDAQSPNQTTPLMMAARHLKRETVKLLIDEGADPTPRNEAGLTAADFAEKYHDQDLANWLRRREAEFKKKYGK